MYGSNGPVWYRGWATDSDEKVCTEVDDVLARTGTRRMVMGHTPDFKVCRPLIFRAGYLPMGFSRISSQDAVGRSSLSTQVG